MRAARPADTFAESRGRAGIEKRAEQTDIEEQICVFAPVQPPGALARSRRTAAAAAAAAALPPPTTGKRQSPSAAAATSRRRPRRRARGGRVEIDFETGMKFVLRNLRNRG